MSKLDKILKELENNKKRIAEIENFYLSPIFWNKLSESEKTIIIKAVTIEKTKFPDQRTKFEMINFFDQKYQIK